MKVFAALVKGGIRLKNYKLGILYLAAWIVFYLNRPVFTPNATAVTCGGKVNG